MFSKLQQMGKNLHEEFQRGLDENGKMVNRSIDESEAETNGNELDEAYKDLPTDVQAKLRKFAKYEAKYPQLLDAYKHEKAKAEQIGVFEKVLQENTPISSISEGAALVEYLNSLNVKNAMLNEELRRLNKDHKADAELKEKITTLENQLIEARAVSDGETKSGDIGNLKEELDTEKEKFRVLTEELESLRSISKGSVKLSELNGEMISLKQELVKKDNILKEKDMKLESLKKCLDELAKSSEEQLKESNIKVKDVEEKFKKVQESLNAAQEQLKINEITLKETEERRNAELNQVRKDNEYTVDSLTKQVKELEVTKTNLEIQLKEVDGSTETQKLRDDINVKASEIQSLQKQLQDEKKSSQEKLLDLETQIPESAAVSVKVPESLKEVETETQTKTSKNKNKKKKNKKKSDRSIEPESVKDTEQLVDAGPEHNTRVSEDSNQQIEKLEGELKQLKNDYAELQAKQNELCTSSSKELRAKTEEIQNLRDMIKEVGDDLVTARDEIKELTFKNKELSDSAVTENHAKVLEKEDKSVKKNNNELAVLRNQHSEVVSAYEKEISEKAAIIKELKEKIVVLGNESDALKEHVKNLESQSGSADELKKDSEAKDRENVTLKSELKSATDKLDKAMKDVELLEKSKVTLSKDLENLNTEKKSLIQTKQNLEKDLMDFNKVKKNEEYLTKELTNLQNTLKHREKTISYFEKQVKDYEILKAQLLDEVTKQKAAAREINMNYKISQDQLARLQKEHSKLKEDITVLTKQHKDTLDEAKRLQDKNEILQDKYESLQEMKSSNSEEVELLKKQCEELASSLKEAQNRAEQLEEELSDNRTLLQERTREAGTIRRLLIEKEQIEDTKINDLQGKLQSAIEDKEAIQTDSDIIISRKDRDITDLKLKNEELQKIVQNWETEKSKLIKDFDLLMEEKDVLEKAHLSNTDNSEEVTGLLNKLKDSLSGSEKKVREYENLNNVLKKLNEELTSKLDRLTKNYKVLSNQLKEAKEKSAISSPVSTRSNSIISTIESPSPVHQQDQQKDGEKISYIRNVLLGFLEHKEQRQQLLPVISMLLQLNKADEKRFLVAFK